jgi:hypothetical protein
MYRLDEQIHGLSDDGQTLITVQVWRSLRPPARAFFDVCRNGICGLHEAYRGAKLGQLVAEMGSVRRVFAGRELDDAAAWAFLETTGRRRSFCLAEDCGAGLPVGGMRCTECHRAAGTVSSGITSGAARRGAIVCDFTGPTS